MVAKFATDASGAFHTLGLKDFQVRNCLMGYITTQSIGKPDLGPFNPPPDNISGQRGSNKIAIFRVKSHTMKVKIFGCFDQLKN